MQSCWPRLTLQLRMAPPFCPHIPQPECRTALLLTLGPTCSYIVPYVYWDVVTAAYPQQGPGALPCPIVSPPPSPSIGNPPGKLTSGHDSDWPWMRAAATSSPLLPRLPAVLQRP